MPLLFEWDESKDRGNQKKHGVGFEEAATVLADSLSLTISDPDHSKGEARFITLGMSHLGRILVVIHSDRADRIRIISARKAASRERRHYEQS